MARLIDGDGSFTLNATDNTDYSLAFGGGIISVADESGHIEAEFFADDAPTVDAVPRALFDDLLKHLCETCMDELYGHCAVCRWNKYRKEGENNAAD